MGKTFSKILTFGSIAVLGVVTAGIGAGLAAGASLSFAVSATLATVGLGVVGASTVGAVALAGLASVASIIGQPKSPRAESTETAYKGPLPPRVGAYGLAGLLGSGCGLYQTSDPAGVAADVWFFHDNWWAPADSVEGFYLGDDRVANGPGVIAGLPDGSWTDGKVEIDFRPGRRIEQPYSQLINLFPGVWTTQHRGDGVASGMVTWQPVKTKNYNKYYGKGQPALRATGRWSTVYDWRDGSQSLTDPLTWKWSENAVLHDVHYRLCREGRLPVEPVTLDGVSVNPAWTAEVAALLQEKWARLFAPTLSYWTAAANDADSPMVLTSYRVPLSAAVKAGARTISVPNTRDMAVGMSVRITALDNAGHLEGATVQSFTASTITLSNALAYDHPMGSMVTWFSNGPDQITEPRYRGCVVHKLTDPHKDTKAAITACYDGWVAPREDGALVCYSGRFYTPTVTIGPDQITSFTFEDGIEDENAVNELVVTYVSYEHNLFAVEAEAWRDLEDIEQRGAIRSQPAQNQVPSHTQARRLAKRMLARAMAPYRGTVTTDADGRTAIGQRYIHLLLQEGGATWYDGPAEITKLVHNLQTGGITFEWLSADSNIDAWEPETEDGDPAPVGNVVAALPLSQPSITSAAADYSAVSDDGTGVRIALTVAGLDRQDVQWFARWRVQGAAIWNEDKYTDVDPGAAVELLTGFVPVGRTIEVEAAYEISDGRISEWSDTALVTTSTDQTAPDAAVSIALDSWGASLNLSTPPIGRAQSYRWRFYTADGATLLDEIVTAPRSVSYAPNSRVRSYLVRVAGQNSAGVGGEAQAVFSNAAPDTIAGVSASGGASDATVSFEDAVGGDVAGFVTYFSSQAGFNPLTQGSAVTSGSSPAYLQNLAAGTYYAKVAAYDAWSARPDLLHFSSEVSFTITSGGGGVGSGGGAGGGGYVGGGGRQNLV